MFDGQSCFNDYKIPHLTSGHHHCHEGWIQLHCPFCTDGTHGWHMGFSLISGTFNCWRCGSHSILETLSKLLLDEFTAKKALAVYRIEKNQKIVPVLSRPKTLWEPPELKPMEDIHKRYLWKRNFSLGRLNKWEIMGTTYHSGDWNWRIVFPIYDITGKKVAWCGRTIGRDVKPKYKMSHNHHILIPPKELLYGVHLVQEFVVIVEGATDVWRLGKGAVATLGIDWSIEQVSILRQFPRRYIMFDPEPQAQKQAQKLAENLSIYPGETELITGLDSDPGDMDQKQADAFMKSLK